MHLIEKLPWPCRPVVRGAAKAFGRYVPRSLFQPWGTRGLACPFPGDESQ